MLLGENKRRRAQRFTTFLGRACNLPILNKRKSRPRNNCDSSCIIPTVLQKKNYLKNQVQCRSCNLRLNNLNTQNQQQSRQRKKEEEKEK